ncbi:MAG: SPOR domain-containing protein [Pseudorhodoplanes sp.]
MKLARKNEEAHVADMAEDHRYRSHDPFARPQASGSSSSGSSDPLAELARLIGQQDPFADLNRNPPGRASDMRPGAEPRRNEAGSPEWGAAHDPFRHMQPSAPPAYSDPYAAPSAQGYGAPARGPQPQPGAHYGAQPHAPAGRLGGQPGAGYPAASHPGQGHQQPYYPAAGADGYPQGAYSQPPQGYDVDPYYQEDAHEAEAPYEELAPARRRGGMIMIGLAVIGLAAVGTAGAFGYRAVFGRAGSHGAPPVITADSAPAKMVPATTASESPSSGKQIYDRVGASVGGQNEKIVSREEKPVDVPVAPRTVFPSVQAAVIPSAMANGATTTQSAPANAASPPAGDVANGSTAEPRRIKTVRIRSDGSMANAPQVSAQPMANTMPIPQPQALPGEPAPRMARPAPQQAPVPLANAPLSLAAPSGASMPAPMPPAPRAAVGTQSAALDRAAAVPGAYVQVSSQRTEAEARNSYRSLQSKYPSVLGDRQAVFRRADLGSKGTFYRAQIGPFRTADQAADFCNALRSAGGQCIIQRN